MCGIFGTINLPFNRDVLDVLAHRGPNDFGIESITLKGKLVSFGHRRLSILDLSSQGHQPMFSADRKSLIVLNGEIYNHLMLKENLSGIKFRGHSDTETIVNYINQCGIKSVNNLNGIFAFAFLDAQASKLFLVRDPFGVKPLYYVVTDNTLIFSSEIKPILKLTQDKCNIDSIAELLRLRYNPAPDTLFQNIKKVRPGHIIEMDLNSNILKPEETSYIQGVTSYSNLTFKDAVDQYGQLFDAAVKRQLLSDVEIGILLSGGVDSALVAACAQKYSNHKLKAFTIGFSGSHQADEINAAKETARVLGLESYYSKINFTDFLSVFDKCISIVEEPLATTSIIPMFYLAELASKHVKVVLTGQGADEPLGGYLRYQGLLYKEFMPKPILKLLGRIAAPLQLKNEKWRRAFASFGEDDEIMQFLNIYSVFTDIEIKELIGIEDTKSHGKIRYFYELLHSQKMKSSVERMMNIDMRMNLADDLLLYTDKITMNYSLECRVPILDIELIKFVESLPVAYRVKINQTKIIHKEFAKKLLPETIIQRKKKGFQSPTHRWFQDNMGIIQDRLLDKSSKFANIFNLHYVNVVLNQHKINVNREKQIFLLLGIQNWLELFT